MFGGYDIPNYAKSGLSDEDIFWSKISSQESKYWTIDLSDLQLGNSYIS
jgi:hypothetical protein